MTQTAQLAVDKWFHTHHEQPYFAVYHSVLVDEHSDLYRPVKQTLESLECVLVASGRQDDETMMFGIGVWKLYVTKGKL